MSALGGIGQQVAGDLFEIGKSAVKGTAKVLTDTVSDSVEQILGAPSGAAQQLPQEKKKPSEGVDEKVLLKRREEKKRFEGVKGELAEFMERKKQQDAQIKQEMMQMEQENKQKEVYEKQKKESFLKQLMRRLAGGSHGETDRQKE